MARKAHVTNAPSAAQAWTQTRAAQANRNLGNRAPVRTGMQWGMRNVTLGRNALVDPETDIWQMAISADDPMYGGDTQGMYDMAAEAFLTADEYFDFEDGGFLVDNRAKKDFGAEVITPTTRPDMDTSPAPLTVVPTNTINPDRPRTVAAGYDRNRETLTVVFRDGTFYNYYDVTYREWQAFRMSKSKGRYILANLDQKSRGYADATAVPVTVRSALYNVMRTSQVVADDTWQQPDLFRIHEGRKARQQRVR